MSLGPAAPDLGPETGRDNCMFGPQRIFPLPLVEMPTRRQTFGRRQAQRQSLRRRIHFEMNETIRSLNWMHGFSSSDSSPGHPNQIQGEVLGRIRRLVEDAGNLGGLSHPPSMEAALGSLLQGRTDYFEPSSPVSLAPYNLELISLPSSLKGAPRAEDLLGADDLRYLKEQERIIRAEPPKKFQVAPYWDPALKYNQRNYRKFLQKLNDISYLDFTLEPSDHAGVFFVWKSDGKRIRMIIDGRSANRRFYDPPSVSLSTAETFSKIEIEIPEELVHDHVQKEAFLDSIRIYAGLSDVKDCFHRIRQPRWLAKFFCFMPIEARHLNLAGTLLEGKVLSSKDLVYPMPGSLCMGCSWSLFFAQRINELQFSLSPQLGGSRLVSDRSPPLVINPSDPNMLHHYVYVDNLGVIGQNQELVQQGVQAMQDHFNSKELLLHPGEVQCDDIKALGIHLDGRNKRTRVAPERLHKVRQALRCLLRRGRCSGKVLEIVIGHATFCGLGCRLVLSVFHSSYKFIQQHYDSPAVIWDSVLQELRVFAGLMVFLEHNWGKGWNQLVSTSDASETGFGVCTAFWPSSEVAAAGRIHERSRFRRTGGHSARESALTSAGFVRDEVSGKWVVNEMDSAEFLDKAGWEVDPCFSEIPAKLLSRDLWTPKVFGTWKFPAHIMELEARALVKSLERICHSRFGHDNHQLLLTDSLSMALAFDRARSRSYRVLQQLRKFAALALSRNVSPHVRWVPSELNSADEPSRATAAEKSKNLIDLIPSTHVQAPQGLGSSSRPAASVAPNPAPHFGARGCEAGALQEIGGQGLARGEPSRPLEKHPCDTGLGSPGPVTPAFSDGFQTEEDQQLRLKLQQFRPASCEKDASQLGSEAATSPCTLCHGNFGSQVSRVDSFGKESSPGQNRGLLYEGIQRVHGVCEGEPAQSGHCRVGGFSALQVHDFTVSSRPPLPQGGQAGRCYLPSPRPVQQTGATVSPPRPSSYERVETSRSRSVSQSLASSSLERGGDGNGAGKSGAHGAVYFDSPRQLCTPIRTISLQGLLPGPANSSCHRPLGYPSLRPGNGTSFEDWGVRRLRSSGQPVPPTLGQALVPGAQAPAQRSAAVGLRLLRLFPCLYPGEQEAVTDCDAVPAAALGAVHRPGPQLEKLAGSSKTWQVEKPEKRDQV